MGLWDHEDTHILMSQLQAQTSDGREDLWDFGSYLEREGDGLLFEKEVLAIQVGKYQKKSKIVLCWRGYVWPLPCLELKKR